MILFFILDLSKIYFSGPKRQIFGQQGESPQSDLPPSAGAWGRHDQRAGGGPADAARIGHRYAQKAQGTKAAELRTV